jgi:hypothetical protein
MSTFRSDLFGGVSGNTSTIYLVADAAEMTLFYDVDSATSLEIHGSNASGFRHAILEDEWSVLTTIAGAVDNGLVNIEPGFRWARVVRESDTSLPSAVLHGRNVVRGHG